MSKTFKPTLKQARIGKHYTQRQVSSITGIPYHSYRAIEREEYACNDEAYEKLVALLGDFKRLEPVKTRELNSIDGTPTLRQARLLKGITQKELSDTTGISKGWIVELENGRYDCKDEYYDKIREVVGDFRR